MSPRSLLVLVLIAGCQAPEPVAGDTAAVSCDLGTAGSFPNACDKASAPVPITAQALASTSVTSVVANDRAYGVRLVAGASGNEGVVTFVAPETATYELYLGTPNIPMRVTSDGAPVAASCSSLITSSECTYLRKVLTYDLQGGHAYRIELGPITTVSYVRLYLQTRTTTPRVCNVPDELTEESAACASTADPPHTVTAVPLTNLAAPQLAQDTVYVVTLPSDASGYAGSVGFLPAVDGDYELYLGTPNIPLRIIGNSEPAPITCSSYLGTSCDLLRRGERLSLRGGELYRLEFGPSATNHYVRVTIRRASLTRTVKLGAPRTYDVGAPVSFVEAADLDRDGATDLVASAADDAGGIADITLLRNTAGTFSIANQIGTSLPAECVISDFDHDGIPDIAGIAWDGQGPLPEFYLHGDGAFAYTKQTWGNGVDYNPHLASADFDEDGTPDLVAAYTNGFLITKMPAFTVLQDEPAFGSDTLQAVAGDFNGDGHQDVVAASRTSSALKLYLGDGTGHVTFAQDLTLPGGPIRDIAAFELSGNYYEDLVAIHVDNTVTVSYGIVPGLSTSALQLVIDNNAIFGSAVAGDFDHDGLQDLAIGDAGPNFEPVVFLSTQNGYARAATLSMRGDELAVGDFNGDGFDDLAATGPGGVTVYLSTP